MIFVLTFIFIFFILYFYSKNYSEIKSTSTLLPPKLLPIENIFLLKKSLDEKMIIAQIIDMYQKGLLKYENNSFIKIQNSSHKIEQFILNALFYGSNKLDLNNLVNTFTYSIKLTKLVNNCENCYSQIEYYLNKWAFENGYFKEDIHKLKKHFLIFTLLLNTILILISSYINYGLTFSILLSFILPILGASFYVMYQQKYSFFIFIMIIGLIFVAYQLGINLLNLSFLITFLPLIFIYFVYTDLGNYTQKGIKIVSEFKGFIENLKNSDKNYLPYLVYFNYHYQDNLSKTQIEAINKIISFRVFIKFYKYSPLNHYPIEY